MSRVKHVFKDLDAAEQFAEKAATANPKDARFRLRLAEAVGEKAVSASVIRQIGLARKFKKELDAALLLEPKNPDVLNYLMLYLLEAPGIVGGDKVKARTIPDEIMRVDPVAGYFAKARIARFDKQDSAVEQLYTQAVNAGPTHYNARITLSNFYISVESKKLGIAETHAREAIRIDPAKAGGHAALAAILGLQERWPDLDAALARAEKEVPDNLMPYLRAANACLARGQELPRAEGYLRKYLGQEPEPNAPSPSVANWRLGLVLEKQARRPRRSRHFRPR